MNEWMNKEFKVENSPSYKIKKQNQQHTQKAYTKNLCFLYATTYCWVHPHSRTQKRKKNESKWRFKPKINLIKMNEKNILE